jgi:hypothetical protein
MGNSELFGQNPNDKQSLGKSHLTSSFSKFMNKVNTRNKLSIGECYHGRDKSNRFMSKVKADAFARKRGKKIRIVTQSEKELQTTDLRLPTANYDGPQAKIFVTSSRNVNTLTTANRENRMNSLGENRLNSFVEMH